tara:strand:- start:15 stop:242 length:228 start_codon:yes stop_codon:yes gene_type:complete
MKKTFFLIIFLFVNNCSLNKDSKYWNEYNIKNKENKKKLSKILKKKDDIMKMSIEEYEIYIDDYTKKSKYPDINK